MQLDELAREPDGREILFVHKARVRDSIPFIDLSVPYVWILGHTPQYQAGWWTADIPLNVSGAWMNAQIQNLTLDLNLETQVFLERIYDFDNHGFLLLQSSKPMPESLYLSELLEDVQTKILGQNGVTLKIHMPHAGETASIVSYPPGERLAQFLSSNFTGGST